MRQNWERTLLMKKRERGERHAWCAHPQGVGVGVGAERESMCVISHCKSFFYFLIQLLHIILPTLCNIEGSDWCDSFFLSKMKLCLLFYTKCLHLGQSQIYFFQDFTPNNMITFFVFKTDIKLYLILLMQCIVLKIRVILNL